MHLKYRPKTFAEFVGNSYLKNSLQNMELNKPIMFEGDAGLGKTTLAYILADKFGASPENITDLNCVYYSKVEDMRDRLDKLYKSSLFGNEKVLILDEIHELSPKTQQVLLKPLENLPNNVLVIACTTTTAKLIGTLVERFMRFKVQPLSSLESSELLDGICKRENILLQKWKKALLISKSEGVPRRLLIGLDKIKSVEDEVEAKYLLDMTSLEENGDALDIMKLIIGGRDWVHIKDVLSRALKNNSPESLRVGMLNLISSRLISDYLKNKEEGERLSRAYDYLSNTGYPEKSSLIVGLYRSYLMFN